MMTIETYEKWAKTAKKGDKFYYGIQEIGGKEIPEDLKAHLYNSYKQGKVMLVQKSLNPLYDVKRKYAYIAIKR